MAKTENVDYGMRVDFCVQNSLNRKSFRMRFNRQNSWQFLVKELTHHRQPKGTRKTWSTAILNKLESIMNGLKKENKKK